MNKSRLREFAPITLILGFALTLRLWRLNQPKGYIFDEIYYAKNAASLINDGVELLRSNIKTFIADMDHMAKEHDAGDVDVVIDEAKYKGVYAQMVHGVNAMVGGHVVRSLHTM